MHAGVFIMAYCVWLYCLQRKSLDFSMILMGKDFSKPLACYNQCICQCHILKVKKKSLQIYSLLTTTKQLSIWINDTLINAEIPCPFLGSTMLMTSVLAQRESSNSVRISRKKMLAALPLDFSYVKASFKRL